MTVNTHVTMQLMWRVVECFLDHAVPCTRPIFFSSTASNNRPASSSSRLFTASIPSLAPEAKQNREMFCSRCRRKPRALEISSFKGCTYSPLHLVDLIVADFPTERQCDPQRILSIHRCLRPAPTSTKSWRGAFECHLSKVHLRSTISQIVRLPNPWPNPTRNPGWHHITRMARGFAAWPVPVCSCSESPLC